MPWMSKKLSRRLAPPLLAPLMLGACAHPPTPTAATAEPDCTAFGPITYSKADTDETIRQIKAHDAAWRAMCGAGR